MEQACSPQEEQELMMLLADPLQEPEVKRLLDTYWNELPERFTLPEASAEAIFRQAVAPPAKPVRRRIITLRRMAAAAAVLLLAAGLWLLRQKPAPQPPVARSNGPEILNDIAPGGNKAVLVLADGTSITLDSARNGVLAKQGATTVRKQQNGQLVYNVGAAAKQAPSFNRLATPRGGAYQLVLPDGSKVWLNAASALRFPTAFTGRERMVELTGEAYFEIAPDPRRPFRVNTGGSSEKQLSIQVLGTHFNVNAYDDGDGVATTLLQGAVRVTKGAATVTMKPGEQALWRNAGTGFRVTRPSLDQVMAWKNGLFQFNGENIVAIMKQLSRWYDIEPVFIGDMSMKDYSGYISRNSNISEVLKMLQLTEEVSFRVEGRKVTVTAR